MAKRSPVPQAIRPGKYRVQVTSGMDGITAIPMGDRPGLFSVPKATDAARKAVRAHEYGHIAIPLIELAMKLRGVVPDHYFQAMADAVVNNHLARKGLPEVQDLRMRIVMPERESLAVACFRAIGLKIESAIFEAASEVLTQEELHLIRFVYEQSVSSTDVDNTMAQYRGAMALATAFMPDEPPKTAPLPGREHFGDNPPFDPIMMKNLTSHTGSLDWIYPELQEPPRTRRKEIKRLLAKKRKASFCGPPKDLLRALLPAGDGCAFSHPRRVKGGTVLLDLSGSMSLHIREIEELLLKAPAATIAGYSGSYFAILAKDGEIIDDIPNGSTNESDGPCLSWLAKQAKPRIWISDGVVTGLGDSIDPMLTAQASRIVYDGEIQKKATISEGLKLLGAETGKAARLINWDELDDDVGDEAYY